MKTLGHAHPVGLGVPPNRVETLRREVADFPELGRAHGKQQEKKVAG